MVHKIRKRDGNVVLFDKEKIAEAIWKAAKAVGGTDRKRPEELANLVVKTLTEKYGENGIPGVEEVQDLVEKILIEEGHAKVAKAYILYRKSHDPRRPHLRALLICTNACSHPSLMSVWSCPVLVDSLWLRRGGKHKAFILALPHPLVLLSAQIAQG